MAADVREAERDARAIRCDRRLPGGRARFPRSEDGLFLFSRILMTRTI